MSESEHPARGPKWDAAEDTYKALMSAFERYRVAVTFAGMRGDSVVGMHLREAEFHLRYARP